MLGHYSRLRCQDEYIQPAGMHVTRVVIYPGTSINWVWSVQSLFTPSFHGVITDVLRITVVVSRNYLETGAVN